MSGIMHCTTLKAKLHRACVTHAELEYEGSCAIDEHLLELAGIHEYEQIHIYNLANGERFVTYAIRAERGSRMVSVNGAAAHLARPGDRIIVCAYATIPAQQMHAHKPCLVYLDEHNEVVGQSRSIPLQVV